MGEPYLKSALTFEQQLALLESRGLHVGNRDAALRALERISYYRLSAYWYPMRVQRDGAVTDEFTDGASFDTALRLYEFDRRLRLMVLDGIERAEVLARTRVTYALSHACHPFSHADKGTFETRFNHDDWYEAFVEELDRSREDFLNHFRRKYDGYPRVPLWMATEVMSFGRLSKMFEGMKSEHQSSVANALRVHRRVAASWLHALAYTRNVCAHHGRLWNRNLSIKPLIPSGYPELWAPVKNDRVYAILCILRHLTTPCHGGESWAVAVRALLGETDGDDRQWERAMMGVPTAWRSHILWHE